MIRLKIDVIEALKNKGYNTNRIRTERIFSEGVLTKFRKRDATKISLETINTLCKLLERQPASLLEYVEDATSDS